MEFENKVVLVTGGNLGGIGGQIAIDFAANGADVAIVSRSLNKLKLTEKKCKEKRSNAKILLIESDLSKFGNLEMIISKVVSEFGRLDVLVNNAGMSHDTLYTDGNLETLMRVNVKAPMFLIHYAVPHLEKTKGAIVNISSITAHLRLEQYLEYSMSKAALDKMSEILARELASKGIRVNSVSPGATNTDAVTDELKRVMDPLQPLGGVVDPKHISKTVLFLASDGAKYTTGANIDVDGGHLATRY